MGALAPIRFAANDQQDMVRVRVGDLVNVLIPYQIGFSIEQSLRMAAKQAFSFYNEQPSFWRTLVDDNLDDQPLPHRHFRRSRLISNVRQWEVFVNPPLVGVRFDDVSQEVDIDTALRLHHAVRRASRRAKAWAGDDTRHSRMQGFLTDANAV